MKRDTDWTDAETTTLKLLWGIGSAGDIAMQLGTRTRNAVIGKAHRLGLGPGLGAEEMATRRAAHLERRRQQRQRIAAVGL